jgi:hypothetical protein
LTTTTERPPGSSRSCRERASRPRRSCTHHRTAPTRPVPGHTLGQQPAPTDGLVGWSRFLTRDPLLAITGSAYGYTGDNPLNAGDPSGLCPIDASVPTQDTWKTCWDRLKDSFTEAIRKPDRGLQLPQNEKDALVSVALIGIKYLASFVLCLATGGGGGGASEGEPTSESPGPEPTPNQSSNRGFHPTPKEIIGGLIVVGGIVGGTFVGLPPPLPVPG